MNLVNELQVSAERENVLTVLREARRLASKLGMNDIDAWLPAEQNGYAGSGDVPQYPLVKGSFVFQTNGPIPVGAGARPATVSWTTPAGSSWTAR